MTEDALERLLATYISTTRFEDLSLGAISSARRSTLDTLGAMLAGSSGPEIDMLVSISSTLSGTGEARLVGRSERVSPRDAAWCNGAMARAREIDDCVDFLPVHPSASAVPALLALAGTRRITGRDFLTALAIGQDVKIRMGLTVREDAVQSGRNNMFKIFGPTAAVAKALGLDAMHTHHALGIAFSFAVGDGQCALDPEAMTLPLQQGIVAQGALLSGLLAKEGFTGAREFLLGRFGYLVAYEPNPRLNYLSEGLGKEFYGEQISIKPFASCRATHPSIELALDLRKKHQIEPESIRSITVWTNPEVHLLAASPHGSKIRPASVHDAQFSVQFTVAAALTHGDVFLKEMSPSAISDERTCGLAERVRVHPDPSLRTGGLLGRTRVEIKTRGSATLSGEIEKPKGGPESPMTWEDCVAKLVKCAAYARHPPDAGQLETLIHSIENLEEMPDVSALSECFSGSGEWGA